MARSILLSLVALAALTFAAQEANAQFRGAAGLRIGINNVTRTATNAPSRVINNTVGRVTGTRVVTPRIVAPRIVTPIVTPRIVTPRVVAPVVRPTVVVGRRTPVVTPVVVTGTTVVRRPVATSTTVIATSGSAADPFCTTSASTPAAACDFSGCWTSEQGELRIYQYGEEFNAQLYMADGRICLLEGYVQGEGLVFGWAIDENTHGSGELCLKANGELCGSYQTEGGRPMAWSLCRKN